MGAGTLVLANAFAWILAEVLVVDKAASKVADGLLSLIGG